jgi:hypothetical protein
MIFREVHSTTLAATGVEAQTNARSAAHGERAEVARFLDWDRVDRRRYQRLGVH